MSTTSPLVFRPSVAQRALAAVLCAGSWVMGVRAMEMLVKAMAGMAALLHQAPATGSPTTGLWLLMALFLGLGLLGGLLLVFSTLGLILIEGSQVLVDEMGISVEHGGLPRPLARRLGAGHLPWKYLARMEKGKVFFILRGGVPPLEPASDLAAASARTVLKFLMVDELERLVLVILEKSPNLTFKD